MAVIGPAGLMQVRLRMAWWWPVYVHTLVLFCSMFRALPDADRFTHWYARALVVEFSVLGQRWKRMRVIYVAPEAG